MSICIRYKTGTYSKGRTGSNHWLLHNHDEVTKRVGERISSLIGIPLENAESYQVVHYDVSQKYDQHWDAYAKNESEKCLRCLKWGGQRMVTALLYLNNVEEGGGTSFPNLNIVSRAEKGKLLVFIIVFQEQTMFIRHITCRYASIKRRKVCSKFMVP